MKAGNLSKWLIGVVVLTLILANLPVGNSEDGEESVDPNCFTDVTPGTYHYVAICELKNWGIINGYEDGSFHPDQMVNRAEAMKMLTIATGAYTDDLLNENQILEAPFVDTPLTEWYTPYLSIAKNQNIIQGYEDGTYRPEQNISLVEATKIYVELLPVEPVYPENLGDYQYDDTPTNEWYAKYVAYGNIRTAFNVDPMNQRLGIIIPNQEMTRGHVAELIYRMKAFGAGYKFGKASYYGAAVQGNNTASGETFNMYDYTAAHPSLPFGTVVEVTNLNNGKSVEVRITDRGPYWPGRVIDLTSSAFDQIASLGAGLTYVQYKVVSTP
ncbi:septal ring lytic transglycosylase RlpA family protein [Patescibacteria group bacterium]